MSINRSECIGCGSCVSLCPAIFEMADDSKSSIKGVELKESQEKDLEDISCGKDAAESCPVTCIHVEEDGKKIV